MLACSLEIIDRFTAIGRPNQPAICRGVSKSVFKKESVIIGIFDEKHDSTWHWSIHE